MDLGIGFISTNIMLPILDFFHGIVPSYGFAIIALTLVIRFAVYPLSAGSIRNMRRTRIAQPVMQKRVKEVQERHKDDPQKLQEEMGGIYKEYGNPLAGCLPLVFQLPILWALFTTLRGSPFTNINYTVDVQILPKEQAALVQHQPYATKPQNIYLTEDKHYPLTATIPSGNQLGVGEQVDLKFATSEGVSLKTLAESMPETKAQEPTWTVTKGEEFVQVSEDGTVQAIAPGSATLQGTIPGLAADEGFFFIKGLGRVGAKGTDGAIHWDIVIMVLFFGVSTYFSQQLTGAQKGPKTAQSDQQQMITKITPIMFSGMFLIFPLPAGVLMYMVVANMFQTAQTFFLMKEPLPENLQKLLDEQEKAEKLATKREEQLPFERKRKKREKPSG